MGERLEKLAQAKKAVMTEMKRQADLHALSPEDVLALCAFMTGSVIAFQDQRKMTPQRAMALVEMNIEAGNRAAINHELGATKGHA